jgi:transcriptional regulator with XRE-family HTH domain
MAKLIALKNYRRARDITQTQLAGELGTAPMTVSRWETGQRKIDDDLLPMVSAKTGIPKRVLRPDLAELLDEEPAPCG